MVDTTMTHPILLGLSAQGYFKKPTDPAYHALQADGSAWSRWTVFGDRAVEYVRDCCRILRETGMPSGRVICCGCNDGLEVEEFQRNGYAAEGFDLDEEKVRVASYCGLRVKVGDMHNPPASDGVYDVAFCSHVLEHCLDRDRAIKNLQALLRPGGICYLVFPLEHAYPWHNPSHTAHIAHIDDIAVYFEGWGVLPPRVIDHPERQCIFVARRPETVA